MEIYFENRHINGTFQNGTEYLYFILKQIDKILKLFKMMRNHRGLNVSISTKQPYWKNLVFYKKYFANLNYQIL